MALGRSPASSSGAWLPVINPGHRERFEHRLAQHVGQSLGSAPQLPPCEPGEPLEIFTWHDEQPPPADCPNALRARASPMTEPLRTAAVHARAIPAADHVPRSAVLTDLRNRGIKDVFFLVCDGLKGLPEVVGNVWPLTTVQTCIIHRSRKDSTWCFVAVGCCREREEAGGCGEVACGVCRDVAVLLEQGQDVVDGVADGAAAD